MMKFTLFNHSYLRFAFVLSLLSLLTAIVPVLAADLEFTKAEKSWIQENPVIRVQSDSSFVPFDFQEDNQSVGYSIDYIRLVAAKLGLEVEFVTVPWNGMSSAPSEKVDVITSVAYTQERAKHYLFSDPYFRSNLSIVKHRRAAWLKGFEDLDGAIISSTKGSARVQLLNEHLDNVNLVTFNSVSYALQAVNTDRADASLVDTNVANTLIPKLSLENVEIINLNDYFGDRYQQFRFAVPNSKPELIDLLNLAIEAVSQTEQEELATKWFTKNTPDIKVPQLEVVESSKDNTYIIISLLLISAILMLFVVFELRKDSRKSIKEQLRQKSRLASLTAVLFVVALLGLSEWGLQQLNVSIKRDQEVFLKTSLFAAQESLDQWVDNVLQQMKRFGNDRDINELLTSLPTYSHQRAADEGIPIFRDKTDNIRRINNLLNLAVIKGDGTILLSYYRNQIGSKHQISVDKPEVFSRVVAGESMMLHSFKVALSENSDSSWRPVLYFATPVYPTDSEMLILVAMVDPAAKFSDLLTTIRPSASGETYAFNRQGMVISALRHHKDLENAGLLRANESAILRVSLRDPGTKLNSDNSLLFNNIDQFPLTQMAKSALNSEMSWNIDGYRDYRGVTVIGAWLWDEMNGLGLATEIDKSEALRTYTDARALTNLQTGLTVIAALTIAFFGFRAVRRIADALQKANDQLSDKVEERTFELQEERRRFQVMIDNVPAVLFMKDINNRLVIVNSYCEQAMALPKEQLIGKANEELFSKYSASRLTMIEQSVMDSKKSYQFESDTERLFTGELAEKQYFVSNVPVIDESNNVTAIVGLYLDITERKTLEHNLIEARDSAEKANRAKSDFLATMSHEIRTPLNGVIGMLNLVLKSSLAPQQYHQLDTAFASAKTLLMLINDILDFSKIEAGRFDLDSVDFRPSSIIEEVCNTLSSKADEKRIELIMDLADLPNLMVVGDPVRLRQILLNLVSNAIKFTDQGEVVIKAALKTSGEGEYRLICSVKDSGIGIAKEQIPLLFSAFTQIDSGTSRQFEGSGLGLAISRRLCRLMNGEVEIESRLGKGTVFSFDVEMKRSEVSFGQLITKDISHAQVLIVDDNHVNRDVLKRQMLDWNVTVTEIANSLDVLPFCLQESAPHFDVILLDMNMPNLDGLSLARMIRNHAKLARTKLLLLPSTNYLRGKQELLELGIEGCLGKPLMPDSLHHALSILVHEGDQLRPQNQVITEAYLKARLTSGAKNSEVSQRRSSWGAGKRVLLVDDNITNQLVAQGFVESLDIKCEIASNGREALDILRQSSIDEPFNMVLMDCQMPIMNGYDATKEIRRGSAGERYHRIPVIAMTAHAMASDRDKCIQSGMDDYLTKPMDFERCTDVIYNWLVESQVAASDFEVSAEHAVLASETAVDAEVEIPLGVVTVNFDVVRPPVAALPSVYLRSLQAYNLQYERIEEILGPFLQQVSSYEALAEIAHAIKGSSGNLGMLPVYEQAEKIEQSCRNQQQVASADVDALIQTVLRSLQDASLIIRHNQSEKGGTGSQYRHDRYIPLCGEILEALESDVVLSNELFEEFVALANGKNDKDVIDAIDGFEYETAIGLLRHIIST